MMSDMLHTDTKYLYACFTYLLSRVHGYIDKQTYEYKQSSDNQLSRLYELSKYFKHNICFIYIFKTSF